MREWFGSWGRELPDLHFACAVMGLGLVPKSLRGRSSPRGMEQAVAEALDESPQKLLHWSLDVLPTVKNGWAAGLSAGRLAELVQPSLSRQCRVALDTESAIDGMTLWKFFRQHFWSASPQECWTFFLSQAAPGSTVRLRWPCRIGYFPGTLSESIALDLKSRDSWEGNIFEISPLTRRRSECDLLIWQGTDLASSIEDLSSESAKIGGAETDLLAIFSMLDLPDSAGVRTMEPLRRMVGATGLLWVPLFRVHPAAEVLRELFMGVSHNSELDVAVSAATRNEGFLLADERLIRRARLDRRLRTTARVMKRKERAHERIKFESSRSGWLGNVSDMLVRRDVGNLILDRLKKEDGYRWEGESHEASAYGHVSRRMQEDDEERRVPRYLQTGLHAGDQVDHPTMGPLMIETPYKVSVFIGERAPSYLSVEEPFPELEPLDDGRAHRLTVVFWEPHFSPEPQIQHIELPPVGNSSVCWFSFHTGKEPASLTARITVLHRNRVLQSGILEARVGPPSAVPSFRVDAAPRQILNGLDERQNFSAAFLLNDMNDSGTVHAVTGDRAVVLSMDDATVKGLVQVLNAAITEITESPSKFEGLRAPGSESLLRTLAQKGASLREYLTRHAMRGGLFSSPTHVQVVSARPAKIFPVEFVYEFEAPEEEARLCAHAEKALEGEPLEGFCPDCTPAVLTDGQPTPVDREMVIRPWHSGDCAVSSSGKPMSLPMPRSGAISSWFRNRWEPRTACFTPWIVRSWEPQTRPAGTTPMPSKTWWNESGNWCPKWSWSTAGRIGYTWSSKTSPHSWPSWCTRKRTATAPPCLTSVCLPSSKVISSRQNTFGPMTIEPVPSLSSSAARRPWRTLTTKTSLSAFSGGERPSW